MQGSLNLSGRAATVKLRVAARNLPPGASVTVTDVMLQPGGAASGWIPHTTELPWAAGMTGDDVGGGGPVYWDEILGKPSQFPPTSHTHSIAQVSGLQAALDAKAAAAHTHTVGQVAGLQGALDGKSDNGHTHSDATDDTAGFMSASDKAKVDGASATATPDTLAMRTASGNLAVAAPTAGAHAATKTYVDTPKLAYGSKQATDAPSTYPDGYSVGLFRVTNGWPSETGVSFWTVVTVKAPSFTASTVQYAYAYQTAGIAPRFRTANASDGWNAWQVMQVA